MALLPEHYLVIISLLLILGVVASMTSSRFGIPALVLFLLVGMLAGSDGIGKIEFNDPGVAQLLGVASLALILFDGGLHTEWRAIRPILKDGISISTIGVLITSVLVGAFACYLLGLDWQYGLLLGAIVSPTDAAAVFCILNSGSSRLRGGIQPVLELESAINDPMAACLTIALIHIIQHPDTPIWAIGGIFLKQMIIGGVIGYGFGKGILWALDRFRLEYEGLYAVFTLSVVLLIYGLTASLEGSGFLSVFIVGIMMGNANFSYKKSLLRFHESLAWLTQIGMFLSLGLLSLPSRLPPVVGSGLLLAAFLIFIARPVSVFIALAFTKLTFREKLMISWVGLRGAVPIVLATFPLLAGVPQATLFFDIVLFIVLSSVLFQGTTLKPIARWLKVDDPFVHRPRIPLEFMPAGKSRNDLIEVEVQAGSTLVDQSVANMNLPKDVLIAMIGRGEEFIVPRGDTILAEGDILLVLADKEQLDEFCMAVGNCRLL